MTFLFSLSYQLWQFWPGLLARPFLLQNFRIGGAGGRGPPGLLSLLGGVTRG